MFDKHINRSSEIKFPPCFLNNGERFVLVNTVCVRTESLLLPPDRRERFHPGHNVECFSPTVLSLRPAQCCDMLQAETECRVQGPEASGVCGCHRTWQGQAL